MSEQAIFGGGCFWCTEAVFKLLKGVVGVAPGYAGGAKPNPTYEEVCSGTTGYVEIIKIEFNPGLISYRDLLTVFFGSHDPTTLNRQGNDVGTQYRSVIFYTTAEQQNEAEKFIEELNKSNKDGQEIVTKVEPLTNFYPAESYHQDYYANNKNAPYCQVIINPKLEKVQKQFANLLADNEWKSKLTPEQYEVLREKGTEPAFSGKLLHEKRAGMYTCAACGQELFASDAKFDSGTGWPSFDQALPGAVKEIVDDSHGMSRTEVVCSRCGSHLGHVFADGPTATGQRFCLNSVCLDLKPKE